MTTEQDGGGQPQAPQQPQDPQDPQKPQAPAPQAAQGQTAQGQAPQGQAPQGQALQGQAPQGQANSAPPAATPATALIQDIRQQLGQAIFGQQEVIEQVLLGLVAGGHVMIEGLPGLGKTLLVRALAKTFAGQSARIQFTPDLLPADIMGHVLYDIKTGEFKIHRGPVFTNLLLADEINRAPAKTQAAMLEVMQERQVTLEGSAMELPPPFMTLATQNPLEHEGTYPLPDAQLDRFLLKIHMTYPQSTEEVEMVAKVTKNRVGDDLATDRVSAVATPQQVMQMQQIAAQLRVDGKIVEYAVALVRATRRWPGLIQGAGPRGSLALVRAARAFAYCQGRAFVIPDDVKKVALPALRHRVMLAPESELEGQSADLILEAVLQSVEAPRL